MAFLAVALLAAACDERPVSPTPQQPSVSASASEPSPSGGAKAGSFERLVEIVDDPELSGIAQIQTSRRSSRRPELALETSGEERFTGEDWHRTLDAEFPGRPDRRQETLRVAGETMDLSAGGTWIVRSAGTSPIGVRGLLVAVAENLDEPDGLNATADVPPEVALAFLDELAAQIDPASTRATAELTLAETALPLQLELTTTWTAGPVPEGPAGDEYELIVSLAVALQEDAEIARPASVWRWETSAQLGYGLAFPESWTPAFGSTAAPVDVYTGADLVLEVRQAREWPAWDGVAAWAPQMESAYEAAFGSAVEDRSTEDGPADSEGLVLFGLHGVRDGQERHAVVALKALGFEAWEVVLLTAPGHEADDTALLQQLLSTFQRTFDDPTWVGTLEAGACFDPVSNWITPSSQGAFWSDGDVPSRVRRCDEPHWFEVVGTIEHFLGADASATEACAAVFEAHVGRALAGSQLTTAVIGNRQAPRDGVTHLCVASDPAGVLSASIRGSRR
jgi:hypothetical protein